MGQITITGGFVVLYDDEDEPIIRRSNWTPKRVKKANQVYVCRGAPPQRFLHRIIMGCQDDPTVIVDHINHNGLDNRKANLRVCTKKQNLANRTSSKNSTSKYLGVSMHRKRWKAQISVNGRTRWLGTFKTQEEAALCYNDAARLIHGEFANPNIIF